MSRLRLVILGMMGRCPFGGQTWLYLNWMLGLSRLGHEVWYVEDDSVWPYDPIRQTITDDPSYATNHISSCMKRIGLEDRWAYRLADRKGACSGLSESELNGLYADCDALLNMPGATALRDVHMAAPLRVYVECDPVTAELRIASGKEDGSAFREHQVLMTYGENYGAADCGVPLSGFRFGRTRQPIDLDFWNYCYDPASRDFTTIGNYRQEGSDVQWNGQTYRWSKHHEWEKFLALPSHTRQSFELAMKVDQSEDRRLLESHGWKLSDPVQMSLDIFGAYPEFFRRSRAEFTVAKDQNVRLRSGWFSDRDACYLACGKPVVAQDTGFGKIIPTGAGLFAFNTQDEALAAIEAINSDYEHHCRAAREIAQTYFRAETVASRFLADIGLAS